MIWRSRGTWTMCMEVKNVATRHKRRSQLVLVLLSDCGMHVVLTNSDICMTSLLSIIIWFVSLVDLLHTLHNVPIHNLCHWVAHCDTANQLA